MRKTYPLASPGKHPDRVVEAVKHDIRKYLRRERRRPLPEGMDYWDFDCRAGVDEAHAEPVHVAGLIARVDAAVQAASPQCYVEVFARAAMRQARPPAAATADGADAGDAEEGEEKNVAASSDAAASGAEAASTPD